jgi:hypothetical protein
MNSTPALPIIPVATTGAPTDKLNYVLAPLLSATALAINQHTTATNTELIILIQQLCARMDMLEKLVGDAKAKKAVATREKKTDASKPAATEAPAVKSFPISKLVWWRQTYKENDTYRNSYITTELRNTMDAEQTIYSKAAGPARLTAEATFLWNTFKTAANKEMFDRIGADYEAAKKEYEKAKAQPQQEPDSRTPDKSTQ